MDALKKNCNERLFSLGMRSRYHFARFSWFREKSIQYQSSCRRILEFGCFDAKPLDFLPSEPEVYFGFDADWEGGLQVGRRRGANEQTDELRSCNSPNHLAEGEPFDIAICMETLEHLPLKDIDAYLDYLRRMTVDFCYSTIPVESGVFFPLKYVYKWFVEAVTAPFRFSELAAAAFGCMHKVQCMEAGRRGFDFRKCLDKIETFSEPADIEGIPLSRLPLSFNPTIGSVATPKAVFQ